MFYSLASFPPLSKPFPQINRYERNLWISLPLLHSALLINSCINYCGKLPQRCVIVIHSFQRVMRDRRVQQDKLWQAVLGDIEISLSRGNYLTWFKNTQLIRQDDAKLVIGVPNVFIK